MKRFSLFLILATALAVIPACTEEKSDTQSEPVVLTVMPETAVQTPGTAEYYAGFLNELTEPYLISVSTSNPERASILFSEKNETVNEVPAYTPPKLSHVTAQCLPSNYAASEDITLSFKSQPMAGTVPTQVILQKMTCQGKTPSARVEAGELTVSKTRTEKITLSIDAIPAAPVTFKMTSASGFAVAEPAEITFTAENYAAPQTVTISAPNLPEDSGNLDDFVKFAVATSDPNFQNIKLSDIPVKILNSANGSGDTFKIRVMAANISSGSYQSYDPGDGIRIFQAVKPDIVLIQEFNYGDNIETDYREMIDSGFGPDYSYYVGDGKIPNGVISKYPILESGHWKSNQISDRDWEWSLIDIPGAKELLAVSLHLSTKGGESASEVTSLTGRIEAKIAADRAKGLDYYIVVGGDFNSSASASGNSALKRVVYTRINNRMPVDQNNDDSTNAGRKKTLDLLFADPELHKNEIPVEIGRHSYPYGHVFDTRVYARRGEVKDVPPIDGNESGAMFMQHMAVIRDFKLTGK